MTTKFLFHFVGFCIQNSPNKTVELLFSVQYQNKQHTCNINVTLAPGPSSSLVWSVKPEKSIPYLVGVPFVPAPVIQLVDSYGNHIEDSTTDIEVTVTGQSKDSRFSLLGSTTKKLVNGKAEFKDMFVGGKFDGTSTMKLYVSSTPEFIAPHAATVTLQQGVPYDIITSWDDPNALLDKCTEPASNRVAEQSNVTLTVYMMDYFGNQINIPLCSPGVAEACISFTALSIVTDALTVIGSQTIQLDTTHLFDGAMHEIVFEFQDEGLVNETYFQVVPRSRVGCFPDVVFSHVCTSSLDILDEYFISKMVTEDNNDFLLSQLTTSKQPLISFYNTYKNYDPAIFKEQDPSLRYMFLSVGAFYTHLGYNYSRFWSMHTVPDYMSSYNMEFQYPICSGIHDLALDGVYYKNREFQKLMITRWIANISYTVSDTNAAKYPILCHSKKHAVSAYFGLDKDVQCCDMINNSKCSSDHKRRFQPITSTLYVLQFIIAALGTVYAVTVFYSLFPWKEWKDTRALKYEIPFFRKWKHSDHVIIRSVGYILQKAVFIFAGSAFLIVFWCLSLAMLTKDTTIALSASIFAIISTAWIIWVLSSSLWYLLESLYRFEYISSDIAIAVSERIYFVGAICNIIVSAYVGFMFISWTSFGFIINPAKVAPIFSAVAFIVGTAGQIYHEITDTIKAGREADGLDKTFSNKMAVFHVGVFVMIACFLSTFIVVGTAQFDEVSVTQGTATILLQLLIAQGTKYLQKLAVVQQDLVKALSKIKKKEKEEIKMANDEAHKEDKQDNHDNHVDVVLADVTTKEETNAV
jgi:hypothetical protein